MGKLLLILALPFAAVTAYAQTSSESISASPSAEKTRAEVKEKIRATSSKGDLNKNLDLDSIPVSNKK